MDLFSGAGGGILAGKLLGWRTVCAVESNAFARSVLLSRQRDGMLERFPIWDDIRTFDGRPWEGATVVSGGFPCQDISSRGGGEGIDGDQSGLWSEMARIIREIQPRFAFVENSPMLTSRGLGRVLGDLAAMGFDAEWCVLGAHNVGAPHKRDRIWIVACNTNRNREPACSFNDEQPGMPRMDLAHPHSKRPQISGAECGLAEGSRAAQASRVCDDAGGGGSPEWWAHEPKLGRMANGLADRVDYSQRLRAIGNGQVPAVAALAWKILEKQRQT